MTAATEPLLLSPEGAAEALSISRRELYRLARTGRLGPEAIKLGGCARYRADELRRWVEHGCPPRREWQQLTSTFKDHDHA